MFLKKYHLLFIAVFLSCAIKAQTSDSIPDTTQVWKKGVLASLNFSQVSLTNWASGGQSSYSANGIISTFLKYKNQNVKWDNSLDIAYGILQQKKNPLIKTDDKIDLASNYSYKAFRNFNYSFLIGFKTQMAQGYNYPNDSVLISDFMAPGYILISLGMDYKPEKGFNIMASPLTGKITIVNNTDLASQGAFGVKGAEFDEFGNVITAGEKIRREYGAYIKATIKKEIFTNITVQSQLDFFSNYMHNPQNIDINWETLVNFKVNKSISANITTHLIYDDDITIPFEDIITGETKQIGPRVQFKEVLGIGISYKI